MIVTVVGREQRYRRHSRAPPSSPSSLEASSIRRSSSDSLHVGVPVHAASCGSRNRIRNTSLEIAIWLKSSSSEHKAMCEGQGWILWSDSVSLLLMPDPHPRQIRGITTLLRPSSSDESKVRCEPVSADTVRYGKSERSVSDFGHMFMPCLFFSD